MKPCIPKASLYIFATVFFTTIHGVITAQSLTIQNEELKKLYNLVNHIEISSYKNNQEAYQEDLKEITSLTTRQNSTTLNTFRTQEDHHSLLFFALLHNHMPLIEVLLNKNIDIDQKNDKSQTPLSFACMNGKITMVKLLIKNNAHVNNISSNQLPLIDALIAADYKEELVEVLIAAGANISLKINQNSLSAMQLINSYKKAYKNSSHTKVKESILNIKKFLKSIALLENSFKNNISVAINQENRDSKVIELFIMNRLNQDPSQLSALRNYFKDNNTNNNIINILEKYKELANKPTLKVIEDALSKEKQIKKLAAQRQKSQYTDLEIVTQL